MSCQPQQCPPHAPLPASTGRGWPKARSGTCSPRRHASTLSEQCPPSTQKAGPLLRCPYPAREHGLWTRALGGAVSAQTSIPNQGRKVCRGRPPDPSAHTCSLQKSPGPFPCHPTPTPRPDPYKIRAPSRGLDLRSSSTHQAAAEAGQEGSRSRPLPSGARTRRPGQRRPRASTEPRAQQQERRGTYCASAGRLPRPLSPKRRRRRGAEAVRAGALSAAGPGLGLGLRLKLGRHRPTDSEARGGL